MAVGFCLNEGLDVVAQFVVPGDPKSKDRPRTVAVDPKVKDRSRAAKSRTYTPRATIEAEQRIGWAFRAAARGYRPPAQGRYGVYMRFVRANRRHKDSDNMAKA